MNLDASRFGFGSRHSPPSPLSFSSSLLLSPQMSSRASCPSSHPFCNPFSPSSHPYYLPPPSSAAPTPTPPTPPHHQLSVLLPRHSPPVLPNALRPHLLIAPQTTTSSSRSTIVYSPSTSMPSPGPFELVGAHKNNSSMGPLEDQVIKRARQKEAREGGGEAMFKDFRFLPVPTAMVVVGWGR